MRNFFNSFKAEKESRLVGVDSLPEIPQEGPKEDVEKVEQDQMQAAVEKLAPRVEEELAEKERQREALAQSRSTEELDANTLQIVAKDVEYAERSIVQTERKIEDVEGIMKMMNIDGVDVSGTPEKLALIISELSQMKNA